MREHVVHPSTVKERKSSSALTWRHVATPRRHPDITNELLDYWSAVGSMEFVGSVDVGIMRVRERAPTFVEMERHHRTSELLVALDGDLLVPLTTGEETPDLEQLEVVVIAQGTGVLIYNSVWHAIPYSPTAPTTCMVVFRSGTAEEDLEVAPVPAVVRVAVDGLGPKGGGPVT